LKGDELDAKLESWTYEEICGMTFRAVLNSDCYVLDQESGLYKDIRVDDEGNENEKGLRILYDNGITLKVSGIIRPSESATSAMLTGSIAYTQKLTEYVINKAAESPAIKAQTADKTTDVITGLPFSPTEKLTEAQKAEAFKSYINGLDTQARLTPISR
jgi:putative ABC transport system permease protein